jgi:acyl-coenzyme A thioesterase PaaI-like protein
MSPSRITAEQILAILREGLPAGAAMNPKVTELSRGVATLQVQTGPGDVRPGGTIAGPFLFGLADLAIFSAVLTTIGPEAMAVTTDATLHFLRKPVPGILVARARLLKEGKRLAVGEVSIASGTDPASEPVAHGVMTYSIPPTSAGRDAAK